MLEHIKHTHRHMLQQDWWLVHTYLYILYIFCIVLVSYLMQKYMSEVYKCIDRQKCRIHHFRKSSASYSRTYQKVALWCGSTNHSDILNQNLSFGLIFKSKWWLHLRVQQTGSSCRHSFMGIPNVPIFLPGQEVTEGPVSFSYGGAVQ